MGNYQLKLENFSEPLKEALERFIEGESISIPAYLKPEINDLHQLMFQHRLDHSCNNCWVEFIKALIIKYKLLKQNENENENNRDNGKAANNSANAVDKEIGKSKKAK